jgi:hypothetical protein
MPDEPPPTRVRAYVPDLMDRSKVAAALRATEVEFVDRPAALVPGVAAVDVADVVIVDLSRPGVLEVLPALAATGARLIGFVSHVDRERSEAASAAGCGEVYPRSAFFSRLGRLLD